MATITDIISDLGAGLFYEETNRLMDEVTQAVLETGKTGSVSIKIEIKRNGERTVALTPDVKAKVPKYSMGQTIFFAENGDLSRQDPRQANLPLRNIKRDEPELREIAPAK